MQITSNMPATIVNLIQFMNKLTKYNIPFYKTSIQTNYNTIAREVRKYYDKAGVEYESTILEHINRNDGRMGLIYDALVRRNLVTPPDEWDIAKLNDLGYKIKQVLNFLNDLTQGKYPEDTLVYSEYRESRGKIFDNKSKLIYLHIPTMTKLVIDPTLNQKYNLCDIVTCYALSGFSSIDDEFNNCTVLYSDLDLSTLLLVKEDSRAWKNFVADSTRINSKKVVSPSKKVITLKDKFTTILDSPMADVISCKNQNTVNQKIISKPIAKLGSNLIRQKGPNNKWGFVNKNGNIVIDFCFDFVGKFSEELAPVRIGLNWMYIDTNGKYAFSFCFEQALGFIDGFAQVKFKGEPCKIDKSGNIQGNSNLVPIALSETVTINVPQLITQIQETTLVTEREFIHLEMFPVHGTYTEILKEKIQQSNSLLPVSGQNKKWGYIDNNGKVVIDYFYDLTVVFTQGLGLIKLNGQFGFINDKGQVVIKAIYDKASSFDENGFANVCLGSNVFQINKIGKIVN